jgi:hypothetical protein
MQFLFTVFVSFVPLRWIFRNFPDAADAAPVGRPRKRTVDKSRPAGDKNASAGIIH